MKNPKVSIIIPVYNCEKYIRECVESALAQDYENLEIIVVDDGSTDATPQILKNFEGRIQCVRQENQGAATALNNGLHFAQGSLVGWLSADDVYMPGKIKHQVEKFQGNSSLALVYTDWIMIDADGRELKEVRASCPPSEKFVRTILKGNFINGSTVLIRKECFERAGYFDVNLQANVDIDMWFRLLKYGYQFGHVPKPLLKYRWHSANQSHNFRLMQSCMDQVRLKAIQTFLPQEIFGDLLENKDLGAAYEWLSLVFARQFTFRAASLAMKKSIRVKASLKRAVLLIIFRLLSTRIILWPLLLIRQIRGRIKRWWLIKRGAKKSGNT